jgi:hypothetical protein
LGFHLLPVNHSENISSLFLWLCYFFLLISISFFFSLILFWFELSLFMTELHRVFEGSSFIMVWLKSRFLNACHVLVFIIKCSVLILRLYPPLLSSLLFCFDLYIFKLQILNCRLYHIFHCKMMYFWEEKYEYRYI